MSFKKKKLKLKLKEWDAKNLPRLVLKILKFNLNLTQYLVNDYLKLGSLNYFYGIKIY